MSIHTTVSIGCAYSHGTSADIKQLPIIADQELYKAKESGRNQVSFFSERKRPFNIGIFLNLLALIILKSFRITVVFPANTGKSKGNYFVRIIFKKKVLKEFSSLKFV